MDEFRHNHYPRVIVQLLIFCFKKCSICRVMIVIHPYLVLYFSIESKSSLHLTYFLNFYASFLIREIAVLCLFLKSLSKL